MSQARDTILDAQSMATDLTSEVVQLYASLGVALFCFWSGGGSPVGNLIVEASPDGVANWDVFDRGTFAVSGNSGQVDILIASTFFRYLRVRYARTSGTGTLTIKFNAKGPLP